MVLDKDRSKDPDRSSSQLKRKLLQQEQQKMLVYLTLVSPNVVLLMLTNLNLKSSDFGGNYMSPDNADVQKRIYLL